VGSVLNAVGKTALLDAAARDAEAALFLDLYAAELAGAEGAELLRQQRSSAGDMYASVVLPLRVRWFDDLYQACVRERGIRQVVLLGAGLDMRPLRLPLSDALPHLRVFEVDFPSVLHYKSSVLGRVEGADSYAAFVCARTGMEPIMVPVDFDAEQFDAKLAMAGHDSSASTAWLIEGVVHYLPRAAVHKTLAACAAASAKGSILGIDMMNTQLLELSQRGVISQAGRLRTRLTWEGEGGKVIVGT